MANIKKNFDIFPLATYTGANLGFVTAGNNILGSIQIEHPETGTMEFAVSNDFDTKEMVDKLWTPMPVRLLGSSSYITSIDFTTTGADPVIVKFGCFSFAFLRCTLTTVSGDYRVIYNVPTGSTD